MKHQRLYDNTISFRTHETKWIAEVTSSSDISHEERKDKERRERDFQTSVFIPGNEDRAYVIVSRIEKKLLAGGNKNKSKIVHNSQVPVPVSPVTLTASPVSVKMSTYEGKTNWETPPVTEHLYLNSLYNTRDLRFSQKYSKDYARLQMKTRLQKNGENLQEYVSEIHCIRKKRRSKKELTDCNEISYAKTFVPNM
ncbi:uncharacterized protein TNCV_4305051 [Trichonephila clavipes]|nr:uncharacterized protein TNCV_4305051 [Trichonephila clavipes]